LTSLEDTFFKALYSVHTRPGGIGLIRGEVVIVVETVIAGQKEGRGGGTAGIDPLLFDGGLARSRQRNIWHWRSHGGEKKQKSQRQLNRDLAVARQPEWLAYACGTPT